MNIQSRSILFVAALVLTSCQTGAPTARTPSSDVTPALEQGETWSTEDDQIARQITAETKAISQENRLKGDPLRRDAHPKHHGCVKAFWSTADSRLNVSDRYGVFQSTVQPLPAWLRLSNGDPKGFANDDAAKDIRGFALKIMGANNTPSGNQDFVAMTSERFFSRDSADYLDLFHALRGGTLKLAWYAARNWTNISIVRAAQVKIDSPLTTNYFIPVPSKIGHQSMRMHFKPCVSNLSTAVKGNTKNKDYLREVLAQSLATQGACFDVLVQKNLDPETNNIEDPTLKWDERNSPWELAGRVEIPAQTGFDTPERMAFCENLSFNPWNSSPDLRPLGQINRVRKLVYDEVSKMRHQENRVPQLEPRNHEACRGETAALCRANQ